MEIQELWNEYIKTRDVDIRNEIAMHYKWLCSHIANIYCSKNTYTQYIEDIENYAFIGLLSAIEKFDPTRSIKFATFAYRRIFGSIIDEVRKTALYPRSVWTHKKNISGCINDFYVLNGRCPTVKELSKLTNLDAGLVQKMINNDTREPLSLFRKDRRPTTVSGKERLIDTISTDECVLGSIIDREQEKQVRRAISNLPKKAKLAIIMRYFRNMKMKDIGVSLGVTESRVSQLCSFAENKIRIYFIENKYV